MEEWPIWLAVNKNMATLHELETTWSLDDLSRAVSFIMVQYDLEKTAVES